jgi:hypothetical protein
MTSSISQSPPDNEFETHKLQILERRLQKPSVDGIELLAGAERIAQLFLRGPQA